MAITFPKKTPLQSANVLLSKFHESLCDTAWANGCFDISECETCAFYSDTNLLEAIKEKGV